MTQSSFKRDTKSLSHPGTKLAPVRVFSCKHPLVPRRVNNQIHSGVLRSGSIKACVERKGGGLSSTVFKIMR